jgi:uncharacterized protein (DUF1015 family)
MKNSQQYNPAVEIIKLANGQDAVNLMQVNDRVAAIVDYQTLQRLTELLQRVDLSEVKEGLIHRVRHATNLPDLLKMLEDEVAFHKTVNIIHTTDIYNKDVEGLHYPQVSSTKEYSPE